MARPERVAVRRRPLQRWAAAALVVTLLGLTLAAVLGSWRQAAIVRSVATESRHTDAYQEAAYQATEEAMLLQAVLRDPAGEERERVEAAGRRTLAAIQALEPHDAAEAGERARLEGLQVDLGPAVAQYLDQLDRGAAPDAQETLEARLEPASAVLVAALRAAAQQEVGRYTARLDGAEWDSRWLQLGTVLVFVLGLAVLTLVGWSNRSHRRLVEQMAAHDALTGLPNRVAFQQCTDRAVAAARAGASRPTVLMLDLDGFKEVNDNLGHHAGDELLVEVGRRLRGALRADDTVARLGGDEFAVLLTDLDGSGGESAAVRIADVVNEPFMIEGISLGIEVSIGIATGGPDDDTASLLRHADIAMYTAKEHRLGHTRFNPGQAHETANRLTVLSDLRGALDHDDEIELHYQPKVSVRTGDVIGAEALARWRHPVRGLIPPNDFIPVLEGTSLIHRFTARVIDLALGQARRWLDEGHRVPVAVNASTRCLLDRSFPETVAGALRRAGVPGDLLCIEITENTVMADPDRAIEVLRRIRELGVSTSIDDFGTGYSSMAYLKILPVDEIKVDRSFVRDMATDHSNYVLVESAVDLGHNLGLKVVAEGVEDDPTVSALDGIGCDVAQGYHYARPLPAEDFAAYLNRRPART